MSIDNNKLKRLKALHLSSLTGDDREAAVATDAGFVLNGVLVEAIPGLLAKLAPDAEEYPVKDIGDGATKTTLPDNSVVLEVPLEQPKKKAVRKKKA